MLSLVTYPIAVKFHERVKLLTTVTTTRTVHDRYRVAVLLPLLRRAQSAGGLGRDGGESMAWC